MNPAALLQLLDGKKTYLVVVVAVAYLVFCQVKGLKPDETILFLLGFGGLGTMRAGMKKSEPVFATLETTENGEQKQIQVAVKPAKSPLSGFGGEVGSIIILAILSSALFTACAGLNPGADPFVVRVEQTSTIAKGTFDLVLRTDHSARAFWREKAPAFHDFCESLREPTQIDGITLPRCSAALWSLDRVKRDYQAAAPPDKATAKDRVEQSLAALNSMTEQANAWLVIVTNQPAALPATTR